MQRTQLRQIIRLPEGFGVFTRNTIHRISLRSRVSTYLSLGYSAWYPVTRLIAAMLENIAFRTGIGTAVVYAISGRLCWSPRTVACSVSLSRRSCHPVQAPTSPRGVPRNPGPEDACGRPNWPVRGIPVATGRVLRDGDPLALIQSMFDVFVFDRVSPATASITSTWRGCRWSSGLSSRKHSGTIGRQIPQH